MGARKDGNNVILTTDFDKVLFADLKNKQSCYNYANSLSGTFQASNIVCSILVNAGKVINNSSAHSWLGYPDSCLICYNDGSFSVKRILAISNEDLPNVKWAISGVGLLDMYNPAAEGYSVFTKNGKRYDYTDVIRRTNHTAIGVDSNGKVCGLYVSNMSGAEVNSYCKKLGLQKAVMLDGGHIASVNCDVSKINTKQLQSNIIQFIFSQSSNNNSSVNGGDNKMPSVMIDAGHGQSDPGAIGKILKLQEKNVVLKLSKMVEKELSRHGIKTYMTRTEDKRLVDSSSGSDLTARANLANKKNVDVYVSIHNNSNTSSQPRGIETYCYKFGANAEKLAKNVQSSLMNELKKYALPNRGVKEANFAVLRETKMPAILTELCFISNESDEKLLNDDVFLKYACDGIVKGVLSYFNIKYVIDSSEEKTDDFLYKVQVGAFSDKNNAIKLCNELITKGYKPFIVEYKN